jgi:hypothetical protein
VLMRAERAARAQHAARSPQPEVMAEALAA